MVQWFIENWYLVVIGLALIGAGVLAVKQFMKLPRVEKFKKIKMWLLAIVIEAERIYGSKTGQTKLSYVYGLFKKQFPFAASFLSFKVFSNIVDNVLDKMRKLLEENEQLQIYVYGSKISDLK